MSQDPAQIDITYYEIHISGRLNPEWAEWFGDMALTIEQTMGGRTCTVLSGPVVDQAALFGILTRIRDLGLRLISLKSIKPGIDYGMHNESYQEVQNEHEPVAQTE